METKTSRRQYYADLRHAGKLHGTIKRALELWVQRQDSQRTQQLPPRGRHILPEAQCDTSLAYDYARQINPRKQRIEIDHCDDRRAPSHYYAAFEYRGSYRGYKGSDLVVQWPAWAQISSTGKYALVHHGANYQYFTAPRGYQFIFDNYGVGIRRNTTQHVYHPTYTELFTQSVKDLIRSAKQHETVAKYVADPSDNALALATAARRWVTIDSVRKTGACRVGIETFCKRAGIAIDCVGAIRGDYAIKLMHKYGESQRISAVLQTAY